MKNKVPMFLSDERKPEVRLALTLPHLYCQVHVLLYIRQLT